MSLQICAPVSVIRNEKPNNSNDTCPYKTAKVRHLPLQIQSLSAQPPLPNVKHALERLPHARRLSERTPRGARTPPQASQVAVLGDCGHSLRGIGYSWSFRASD